MTDNQTTTGIGKWNRKFHIYVGLYMLLFMCVFSVSGLFMNHPKWFHHQGQRTTQERSVRFPEVASDLAKAKDLMGQLEISGEIILRDQQKPGHFAFIAVRPNQRIFVNIDLQKDIAKMNLVKAQPTATLEILHTFTGVRGIWRESDPKRDWIPTRFWSFGMDALGIGLIFLVVSSLYMGFQLKERRLWILLTFGLGVLVCSFFIWGLAWVA
jgi:hypothetical protein